MAALVLDTRSEELLARIRAEHPWLSRHAAIRLAARIGLADLATDLQSVPDRLAGQPVRVRSNAGGSL
jgi:hypothetical protein